MSEALTVHTLGHEFRFTGHHQIYGKTGCVGLNENATHRLIYLNTLSSLGRAVWERLGGVAVLEEYGHGGYKIHTIPCLVLVDQM